jgi:multidrug efflux pump subunit AcrB
MWLVRLGLKRPYTFVVMAIVIALAGVLSIERTPKDVFPTIDIPVVAVIWQYTGLQPEDMEKRIITTFERIVNLVVSNIDHIESLSVTGMSVVKVYLQPNASVQQGLAEAMSAGNLTLRSAPPGLTPPVTVQYSATAIPVLQIAIESDTMSEGQLYDLANLTIRPALNNVPGVQIPLPYGGRQRTVMIDIDPDKLQGTGLSARDIQNALSAQNIALPTGTAKFGANEYPIVVNSSPVTLEEIATIPVKTIDQRTIYVRDIANVRDGALPQTNLVHVEGRRSVLLTILKKGDASTPEVVAKVRAAAARTVDNLPKEIADHVKVKMLFDHSVFVKASITSVLEEGIVAAALTGLLVLMFLGSWRSTLTVIISIPLSIFFSIVMLSLFGQTLNVMTLGGLALAVGILIDDATVEIENIHRNLHQNKPITKAILDGASQIAVPAIVSTLCICIVFGPIAFLTGAARALFVPLAMAVVFAMMMSYFLSRTLVPTMVHYLLPQERGGANRWTAAFEKRFTELRAGYGRVLAWSLERKRFVVIAFALFIAGSLALTPIVGRDFFPAVDAGLVKLHVRGAAGTRIEETEKRIAAIERTIRSVIPAEEIDTIIDNTGTPYSPFNLAYSEGVAISPADTDVLIALRPGHRAVAGYVRALRRALHINHPESTCFFLATDVSTQILNFGLSAPIDLQVTGPLGADDKTEAFARDLARKVAKVPGAVDVHLAQVTNVPEIQVDVDRAEAKQAGVTAGDVATDVLASLASSGQFAPTFWVDKRGLSYLVAVQTPQYAVDSVDAMSTMPISTAGKPQTLGNLARIRRTIGAANVTHSDATRTYDVQLNIDGTDLGSVVDRVRVLIGEANAKAPKGTKVQLKGQADSMDSSYESLRAGIGLAMILVYLLMVVFYQSWLDPFIILTTLPGALAGIVWMLFLTGTTFSVPALIGSMMSVGVATANSILLVSFANDQRKTLDAQAAARTAGIVRLRPVLMTALAMIVGMLPIAIGFGEGNEQNAPLGRAVIGGLVLSTLTTLVLVPVMYSLIRRRAPVEREALHDN